MYGLPPDIDLSFFNGRSLQSVEPHEHMLDLKLDSVVHVRIESTVEVHNPSGIHKFQDYHQAAHILVQLLYRRVRNASGTEDGTLKLELNDGSVIVIYDGSDVYESYQIEYDDQMIIV